MPIMITRISDPNGYSMFEVYHPHLKNAILPDKMANYCMHESMTVVALEYIEKEGLGHNKIFL